MYHIARFFFGSPVKRRERGKEEKGKWKFPEELKQFNGLPKAIESDTRAFHL